MPIHEEHLIRPENITTNEDLVIDGIDVSGHWSTFIESRVVTDYNEDIEEEIAALPGGLTVTFSLPAARCCAARTPTSRRPWRRWIIPGVWPRRWIAWPRAPW